MLPDSLRNYSRLFSRITVLARRCQICHPSGAIFGKRDSVVLIKRMNRELIATVKTSPSVEFYFGNPVFKSMVPSTFEQHFPSPLNGISIFHRIISFPTENALSIFLSVLFRPLINFVSQIIAGVATFLAQTIMATFCGWIFVEFTYRFFGIALKADYTDIRHYVPPDRAFCLAPMRSSAWGPLFYHGAI